MSITFACSGCGRTLQVGDTLVGKRVKCPQCEATSEVPAAAPPPDSSPASAAPSSAASAAAADQWHLKTPDGQHYGPLSRAQLDAWAAEQRISADCQLWQEGWPSWQWAGSVIPALAAATPRHAPLPAALQAYPTAAQAYPAPNPYQSPAAIDVRSTRYVRAHRGGLILTFGILSIVMCAFFGPAAWIMGNGDLRLMRAGLMDREGEGLTQAGRIMGMIASILMILGALFYMAVIMFVVLAGATGRPR